MMMTDESMANCSENPRKGGRSPLRGLQYCAFHCFAANGIYRVDYIDNIGLVNGEEGELGRNQSQVDVLQAKLMEVKACIQGFEEDARKELEVLWRRVKATATLLTYLKSKARLMAIPHLAHMSYGIKLLDGVGLVDRSGISVGSWSRNIDFSSVDNPDEETWIRICNQHDSIDEQDGTYIGEVLQNVQMITSVMESIMKRVGYHGRI
ncbi:hypothetical protein U1Q18_013608 [Sarracenia purpurea var. burkii]